MSVPDNFLFSPPKKRQRLQEKIQEKENDSFTIKSFYGGREKKQFPHSPKRRRAVNKVLEKISDDNTDSDSDGIKRTPGKVTPAKKMFDFHSSNSGDSDYDPVAKNKGRRAMGVNKKVPLPIKQVERTPKQNKTQKQQLRSYSTSKLQGNAAVTLVDKEKRPNSERKFFKNRSPGEKHYTLKSLSMVKKGFDMRFTPNRSREKLAKTTKSQQSKKKVTSKTKLVDKISAAESKRFKNVGLEMQINSVFSDRALKVASPIRYKLDGSEMDGLIVFQETHKDESEKCVVMKGSIDSGLDMPSSNDLVNSSSGEIGQDVKKPDDTYGDTDTIALLSVEEESCSGSEDLFSASTGCETPLIHTSRSPHRTDGVNRGLMLSAKDEISQPCPASPSSGSDAMSLISDTVSSIGPESYPIFNSKQGTPQNSGQLQKLR